MRLVLDTNVVISAFINPRGKPSQIVRLVLERKAELCYNAAILGEYEGVALRPKFTAKIRADHIRRFIDLVRNIGISFVPAASAIALADESDRIFYDTVRESGAVLITGNTKHFPREPFIMQPAEFLSRFAPP